MGRGRRSAIRAGDVYNKWTVLERANDGRYGTWRCRCACGREFIRYIRSLVSGISTQCRYCAYPQQQQTQLTLRRQTISGWKRNAQAAFRNNKRKALRRGWNWELELNDFIEITQKACRYADSTSACSAQLVVVSSPTAALEPFVGYGIDRKDNTKGYTKDNCVACCTKHNSMKNATTLHIARCMLEDEALKEAA